VPMAEIHRGKILESVHVGHAVIARSNGEIVEAFGDSDQIILPRSSIKMMQALPLVESGAAKGLTQEQLALACASHSGELRHVERVSAWLHDLGLDEHALCCGPQASGDRELRHAMIRERQAPTRVHNNCSGKHAGFLTLTKHLGARPDYVDPEHPVQKAVKAAIEETCGEESPGFGIDGCSAPNYVVSLAGFARGLARFASSEAKTSREKAATSIRNAMMTYPGMVAGKGRACTELMQAAPKKFVVKTGAEGVFAAIIPELDMGIALKISDGATRAAEVAIAALLVRVGALDAKHPTAARYLERPIKNWDGLLTGAERAAPHLLAR
ncbi:MAG: asparaginase, partial [Paracoccaceae bacterium]